MIRGFVTGLIWGGVVATTGLAVLSQVAPLPNRDSGTDTAIENTAATAEALVPEVVAPEAVEPLAENSPEGTPETVTPDAMPEATPGEVPEAAPDAAPDAVAPAPEAEILQPEILQKVPDPAPEAEADLPAADDANPLPAPTPSPTPDTGAPLADAPSEAAITPELPQPAPQPPAPAAQAAPVTPGMPEEGMALPGGISDPAPGLTEVIPPAVPEVEAAPLPPAPPEEALLQPAPEDAAPPAPALIVPDAPLPGVEEGEGGLALVVPGVRTDRLPRIGDDGATAPQGMDTAPEAGAEAAQPEVLLGTTPLELFRRDFDNPEAKPIFGLILIDEGLPAAERETLAALPFPVTFALDPLAPYSADAARVYRAAGQEVAMVANGIPEGATPGDLEQTFQALDMAMPEAVAVLDRMEGGFQDSLDLARQAVPIVAEQGRGVVTYDRGLNSADQVARREGVPRAMIFRVLDSEGESIPKMRNYLDRAAFKAAQEGRVLVIGRARAETVAAILEWTVEGRASSVALAPLSAVLETTPNP